MPSGIYLGNKGKKLSKETKRKISQALKGIKRSEKTKQKISQSRKGIILSEDHKRKLSEANKGKKHSEETKRKISISGRGRKVSEETKQKISKSEKGKYVSPKIGIKISEANSGEKHYNWQNGISFEPYSVDWTETLKRAIRERDNYICQLCSRYGNVVHHIDYNKKNCNPDNLITLCLKCNSKVNFNRDYWKNCFNTKL